MSDAEEQLAKVEDMLQGLAAAPAELLQQAADKHRVPTAILNCRLGPIIVKHKLAKLFGEAVQ